jgi:hypothetical protein
MYARRIFAAAAIVIATASGAGCGGGSPTLSNNVTDDGGPTIPDVPPPTDTAGFIPDPMIP